MHFVGKLDTEPEIRLRVGVYGYWQPLSVTAVFTGCGSFKDLYLKEASPDAPTTMNENELPCIDTEQR